MAMTTLASTLLLAGRTAPATVQQLQAGALLQLPLMCGGLHTHQCTEQQPSPDSGLQAVGEYDRRTQRGKVGLSLSVGGILPCHPVCC